MVGQVGRDLYSPTTVEIILILNLAAMRLKISSFIPGCPPNGSTDFTDYLHEEGAGLEIIAIIHCFLCAHFVISTKLVHFSF